MNNMKEGFYFKELRVIGRNKSPAKINFEKGLNVISGPSNTGKSYVFNCLDYILGKQHSPKNIPEADGYDEVRLHIKTYSDEKDITISRKFGENDLFIAESDIEGFDSSESQKVSFKHNPKTENNLSKFLLGLIGLKGCKLKVNERNEKRQISFRDIKNLCMVDEKLIITEDSPIYTGQNTSKTAEDSVFKLILSGKDDDDLETLDDPKIYKSKLRGKIELITQNIEKSEKELEKIKKDIGEKELRDINIKIDELTHILNISRQGIIEKEKEREKVWDEIKPLISELEHLEELNKRLILLDRNYENDLKRMDFINEGGQIISQLNLVFCPLCESTVEKEKKVESSLFDSIKKEYNKILLKRKELKETLKSLEEQKKELADQLKIKREFFKEIEKYISNKLKPIESIKQKELEDHLKLRELKAKIVFLEESIQQDIQDKAYYEKKLQDKPEEGQKRVLSNDIYNEFGEYVKSFLDEWGFNVENVEYDRATNDILIDRNHRKNHGKGYRAIFLSSFLLGLMKYCLEKDKKHPFFLVLDSPLTSYKGEDIEEEEDKISEDIQDNFFNTLEKFGKDSETQIIVLDNKEPKSELAKNINYEHFSKNPGKGREGFFPK